MSRTLTSLPQAGMHSLLETAAPGTYQLDLGSLAGTFPKLAPLPHVGRGPEGRARPRLVCDALARVLAAGAHNARAPEERRATPATILVDAGLSAEQDASACLWEACADQN